MVCDSEPPQSWLKSNRSLLSLDVCSDGGGDGGRGGTVSGSGGAVSLSSSITTGFELTIDFFYKKTLCNFFSYCQEFILSFLFFLALHTLQFTLSGRYCVLFTNLHAIAAGY